MPSCEHCISQSCTNRRRSHCDRKETPHTTNMIRQTSRGSTSVVREQAKCAIVRAGEVCRHMCEGNCAGHEDADSSAPTHPPRIVTSWESENKFQQRREKTEGKKDRGKEVPACSECGMVFKWRSCRWRCVDNTDVFWCDCGTRQKFNNHSRRHPYPVSHYMAYVTLSHRL